MPNAQQSVDRECWRAQKPGVCCVRCAAARLSCNLSQFTKYQNNLSEMNWNERFRVNYVNICIESSTGNTIDTPYCRTPTTTALNQQLSTPGAGNSFSFDRKWWPMHELFVFQPTSIRTDEVLLAGCDCRHVMPRCRVGVPTLWPWACEESRLWKKQKNQKRWCINVLSALAPLILSWSKAMMFTSSGHTGWLHFWPWPTLQYQNMRAM